jgi:hypothetical protein
VFCVLSDHHPNTTCEFVFYVLSNHRP